MSHNRSHPLVNKPHRNRSDTCRKEIGVRLGLPGRRPLKAGQPCRKTHDDLHGTTIPHNHCNLIKIAIHPGVTP